MPTLSPPPCAPQRKKQQNPKGLQGHVVACERILNAYVIDLNFKYVWKGNSRHPYGLISKGLLLELGAIQHE